VIETERLLLRAWRDDDRGPFLAMCNSIAVMEHLGGPATAEAIDAAMARSRASQAAHGHCFWALERKVDGAFLGFCGLKVVTGLSPAIEGDVEIGWRLREDAWGQGYAREAAEASLAWGWSSLAISRIVAFTVPANARSWRLMERLGLRRRPGLDFGHPAFASTHPLHAHITYAAERPVGGSAQPA
jgi:RimJ/RimL family protein N-acetyltransferase